MPDDEDAVRLSSEPGAAAADIAAVGDRIDAWNMAVTGVRDYRQVAIFLRDDGGQDPRRRHGWRLGRLAPRRLAVGRRATCAGAVSAAISCSQRRPRPGRPGARGAFLETHSFQAPGLYRRLGYEVIAEIEDYPPGESQLVMRKSLA